MLMTRITRNNLSVPITCLVLTSTNKLLVQYMIIVFELARHNYGVAGVRHCCWKTRHKLEPLLELHDCHKAELQKLPLPGTRRNMLSAHHNYAGELKGLCW